MVEDGGNAQRDRAALLIVDTQNDFCPGGSLPVAGGNEVVPVLNDYIGRFHREANLIVFSRDWHPARTTHFRTLGGPWPEHCIQGTRGAEFHPDLNVPDDAVIVSKGMGPDEDGYSAFVGRDEHGASLAEVLRRESVRQLVVGGLATDYCVLNSVLEALDLGLAVEIIEQGTKGVDVQPGDAERAVQQMRRAGARFI